MTSPAVSFEFFPPKSIKASFRLWDTVQGLAPFDPSFVSVTYGAGGSTRKLTHEVVTTLARGRELPVAAHLTCVGATKEETLEIADSYAQAGITDIVALRGDPPSGGAFEPTKGGFDSSVALIKGLKARHPFNLRVGAYPEPHPEAASPQADIDYLKAKFDAGADSAITQFFFEAETFLRFRDACVANGIDKPILPGILPIEDWSKARSFAIRCGMSVPAELDAAYATAKRDGREELLSLTRATEMCSTLIAEGVSSLHFYTLNKPDLTRDICTALGVPRKSLLEEVA